MKIEIISGKKWKYRLPEDETFIFDHIGLTDAIDTLYITMVGSVINIKKGYAWDGSSIPLKRIAKFISFGFWDLDKYCKVASLHHDALYQLMRLGLLPKIYKDYVDSLYRFECISGGMSMKEAAIRFWALQKFSNVDKKEKPNIIIEV